MNLKTEPYLRQVDRWPSEGRVVLAQYDADSVVLYQAYRPSTGQFAARHGYFGPGFRRSRMTWIKPNFLWMMYRSGWGTKAAQQVTLALRLQRVAFDQILAAAVHSTFKPNLYPSRDAWQQAVAEADVRLQWDPDHDPRGTPLARRAIQLGLRGEMVQKFVDEWIVGIEDISEFVAQQRPAAMAGEFDELLTPHETPYPITDFDTATRLEVARASRTG